MDLFDLVVNFLKSNFLGVLNFILSSTILGFIYKLSQDWKKIVEERHKLELKEKDLEISHLTKWSFPEAEKDLDALKKIIDKRDFIIKEEQMVTKDLSEKLKAKESIIFENRLIIEKLLEINNKRIETIFNSTNYSYDGRNEAIFLEDVFFSITSKLNENHISGLVDTFCYTHRSMLRKNLMQLFIRAKNEKVIPLLISNYQEISHDSIHDFFTLLKKCGYPNIRKS